MPDPLQHVEKGDPISAAAWNGIVDGVRRANERAAKLAKRPGENPFFWQRSVIRVQNASGADRARFEVLGFSGALFEVGSDTFKEFPRLTGIEPDAALHQGKFCILLESISAGAVGRACASGVTVARVDVSNTAHQYAEIKDAYCSELESRLEPTACMILTPVTATGTQWALVRIGGGGGGSGGSILWAIVQSGFTNADGQLSRTISVKSCDYLGTNVVGNAFDVFTPSLGAVLYCTKYTALFTGYVLGYQDQLNAVGQAVKIVVTDVWDDRFGSLRMVTGDGAISDGWTEYEAARGRFVLGISPEGGNAPHGYAAGPGSGPTWDVGHQLVHGGDPCGHGPHDVSTTALNGIGVQVYPFSSVDAAKHVDEEHTPPYIGVKLIERTS